MAAMPHITLKLLPLQRPQTTHEDAVARSPRLTAQEIVRHLLKDLEIQA